MNFSSNLDKDYFKAIGSIADELGMPAFVVGGWVRDLIMNRPSGDVDIVVQGSGIELAQAVAKHYKSNKVNVFKNFGTAMVKIPDGDGFVEIEFVGARKESYRRDSRKPIVEDGTLEDDQQRRDFTINAMAISLNINTFGDLVDPFDGLYHIAQKIIKTPLDPEITFSDDPLRMMRAIRFATQLNFEIDPKTFDAIKSQAYRLEIVSMERIAEELRKIIMSAKPSIGFKLLDESGLLMQVFPELLKMKGVDTVDGISHKDNFYHTIQVLDNIAPYTTNYWLRLAAILHDIGKPATKRFVKGQGWTFHGHEVVGANMVAQIFRRLKLPVHEDMKYVQKIVRLHLRPIALVEDVVTDSAIRRLLMEAGDDVDDLMTLCHADITSKNERKVQRIHRNYEIVKVRLVEIEENDKLRNWQPPISGDDIMKYFNIKPSREVGLIKNKIREAILDGSLENDFDKAFSFMVSEGVKLGLKLQNNND